MQDLSTKCNNKQKVNVMTQSLPLSLERQDDASGLGLAQTGTKSSLSKSTVRDGHNPAAILQYD